MNNKKTEEYKEGTRIIIVLVVIGMLLLSIVAYLTYLELWGKQEFMDNAYNQRQWEKEEKVLRGKIVDRNGEVLAYSEFNEGGSQQRIYPYANLYSHVIGYNSRVYGKSQLELKYNKNLAGMSDITTFSFDSERQGETLHLTLSHKLQSKAKSALGNRTGAVVAIEPSTGEILCLYGYPNFDPSDKNLNENWDKLTSDEDSPFLPRATLGLYTPGSVMKTVWAAAAVENGLSDFEIDDTGEIEVDGKTFKNSHGKAHGNIDLKKAFSVSSNVAFISLGEQMGETVLKEYAEKFGFDKPQNFELTTETPKFGYGKNMSKTEIASVSIGQGKLLTTPLHMAHIAATVANNGISMKPYLVEKSEGSNGIVTINGRSQIEGRVIEPSTASYVKEYMRETVESGTGTAARISGIPVAGKTGTAETGDSTSDHSWFIAFAPVDNPKIAVAVVLEHGGAGGGASAAPIAREIIKAWLD